MNPKPGPRTGTADIPCFQSHSLFSLCYLLTAETEDALQSSGDLAVKRTAATMSRWNDWRRAQIDVPSRAEAIRRMVELAAKMKKKPDADR